MAEKSLDFEDYREYSGSPDSTKQSQMQDFMSNQNKIVDELAKALAWQPSTTYSLGRAVFSSLMPAGYVAICSAAGVSGAIEPNWTSVTLDGSCQWKLVRLGVEVSSSIVTGNAQAAQAGAVADALATKLGISGTAQRATADANGNTITFTASGIKSTLGNTAVNRAVADANGNTIDAVVDNALSSSSTHPVQNKVVKAAIDNVDPTQKSVTVTASTQADITVDAPVGSQTHNYFYTSRGLGAQTDTFKNIIQKLVNLSHSHSNQINNCNCDCDCTCDCSGGE